jgi:flagellar biogenesis protein FliO
MKNWNREQWIGWVKVGCFVGCLLVPMTASGITFESEEAVAEVQAQPVGSHAPALQAVPAENNGDVKPSLRAMAAAQAEPAAAIPAEEGEAFIGTESRGERGLLSWIALALLGIGAFGSLFLLKKKNKAGGAHAAPGLELIQSIRLGAKHQVSLVRVPGATLVLGVTEKGIQTLAELPGTEEANTNPAEEWIQANEGQQASVQKKTVEEAPNPFLDKVLNMTHRQEDTRSNPFTGGGAPSDQERRAVLKRLEQYRQGI